MAAIETLPGSTLESYTVQVPTMHITEVQRLSKERPIDIAIVSSKSYDTEWCTVLAAVGQHMDKQTGAQARSNLQRPSMAQGMQKGRRTEIGEINGFIVQKAKEAGCTAPTHERMVEIVRRVERGEVSPRPELLFDI